LIEYFDHGEFYMNTEMLQTYVTLCRIRNFRRTAEELFITQSTVTARIVSLEQEVGAALLIRNHNGLVLTPEGETFLGYAKRLLEMESTALQSIQLKTMHKDLLRIGSTETIFEGYLTPRLQSLTISHPNFRLKFTIGESIDLFQMMQEGILDILYVSRPFQKKGFVCRKLLSEPFVLIVSPDIGSAGTPEKKITIAELLQKDIIYTNYALGSSSQWMEEIFPINQNFLANIHDGTKALRLALAGLGYCILPFSLCAPYIKTGQLCSIELTDFSLPDYEYYVVRPEAGPAELELLPETPVSPAER